MAFSYVFPFLLPTHSVDCAVHLLLSHSRALLVSSALFHPFTALKCPFDGPFTALKCPFQMAPCPSENLGRTLNICNRNDLLTNSSDLTIFANNDVYNI